MAVTAKATQEFIPIREIRDGVVILNDNSLHMILMASTLNFALKSEDEQEAIILQYQNFLNSLDFPAQFFIESRKLDIGPYISSLQDAGKEQVNELLKIQIREYIEFVKNFVRTTNVVSKTFYIIVSYSSSIVAGRKGILGIFEKKGGFSKETKHDSQDQFGEVKLQLQQRADVVQQGLIRCGIRVVVLNTEELIELFYKLFNPGELEKEVVTSNE
jgi:type IV secretory pathway VirB4 component